MQARKVSPSKPKTSAQAKKERKKTEQEIQKTSKQLKANEARITKNLREVSRLEGQIQRSEQTCSQLQLRIDSLTAKGRALRDSIKANEQELQRLRELYIRAVRSSRKNRREMSPTAFLFSAQTVRQAWRRMNYLEEFSKWRERKTREINTLIESLQTQKAELEDMRTKVIALRREAQAQQRKLQGDRKSLETAVGNLKGKQKELNKVLEKQKSRLTQLDREIERLIQAEIEAERRRQEQEKKKSASAKKAESSPASKSVDKKPAVKDTGFASQRGALPSPLSAPYTVVQGFGVQQHRSIKGVEVNNPGVDLETAPNAVARAIYPGEVSAIFVQEGLGHVVLVRHGSYLTVYANVKSLRVSKGAKLQTGDAIGSVGLSDVDPAKGYLHFEIRREREKFNPLQWLRR